MYKHTGVKNITDSFIRNWNDCFCI